jgi:alpha-L-fucosidase
MSNIRAVFSKWLLLLTCTVTIVGEAAGAEDTKKDEALKTIDQVAVAGPYQPNWKSLEEYKVPKWYLDAKFGIFIHWGLYSVPAFGSEWYPRNMYQQGSPEYKHHMETYGPQSKFGYKDFIPQFKAEKFDPDHWASVFKAAGAKFVVPVAEHHDGFPMYDCSYTDYSAAKMGPKRDIVGDLAKAIRKQGLVLGVSSHRAEHWWFFDGGRKFDSDVKDPKYDGLYGPAQPEKGPPPSTEYLNDWLARTCELVDKYHPQLVWFDWWIEQPVFQPYLQKFGSYYYNRGVEWNKGVAINYKFGSFPDKAAVLDIERGQLASIRPFFWQTDTAVAKNSWGYTKNQDYKNAGDIVGDLVDIVSKNGALLLNIGPRSDGTIPEPEEKMLREIGGWLSVNGEAIYGSRPWKMFGEGPTKVSGGSFNDTKRSPFTGQDVRFTRKGDQLFAVIMAWPGTTANIKALATNSPLVKGNVKSVALLGHKGKLEWTRNESGLSVTMPGNKPCDFAYTLKITGLDISGAMPIPTVNGSLELGAEMAEIHGSGPQVEHRRGGANIGFWDKPDAWVSWNVHFPKPGTYTLTANLASGAGASKFIVDAGGQNIPVTAPSSNSWDDFRTVDIGKVVIKKAGDYAIAIKPDAVGWKAINLAGVTVKRTG